MFNLGEIIDKEFIFSRISQEEIFEKYLNIKVEFGKKYKNPLREDNNPDCYFNYSSTGILKFIDFAKGWNWDCFNVVQIIYKCNFKEALLIISNDFNLSNKSVNLKLLERIKLISNSTFKCKIDITHRDWRKYDLDFWNQYYIDLQTLQFYKVYPVEYAWVNDKLIYRFNNNNLVYCYFFNGEAQLYLPFVDRSKTRFYITSSKIIMGYEQLPLSEEYLIITKSYKDIMSLSNYEIPAISPSSETILFSQNQMNHLSKRFKKIFTLFDNDSAGKKLSIKYKNNYNTTPLIFPNDMKKDFSDNIKYFGINFMNDYIQNIKDELL